MRRARPSLVWLSSLLLFASASAAQAVKVHVTYEISGSIFIDYGIGGGGTESITGGTATIRYVNASPSTTAPGAFVGRARLLNMTLTVPAPTFLFFGYIPLQGGPFVLAAPGVNDVGQLGALGGPLRLPLALSGEAVLAGQGLPTTPYDTDLGFYAVDLQVSLAGVFSDPAAHPTVDTWLTWNFSAFGGLDPNVADYRYIADGTIRLREVSRTVVPEPATGSLFWLGLLAIAGMGSRLVGRGSVRDRR